MSLTQIKVPDSIRQIENSSSARRLIDLGHDRITDFMLSSEETIENFVNCDFHLVDQGISWLQQNHLLTGNRFCELGSGFGVVTLLANDHGMEAIGIEIEPALVEQSVLLAEELDSGVDFYCGSFLPRDMEQLEELASEVEHVDTHQGDIYRQIGLAIDDFDLLFAFPWPGEYGFFESIFDACGASGALLMTYRGRDGVDVVRKS